ncbi:hypothetical protein FCV50_05620 [Vibrio kanaloae]|uniref:Uncharacterized protein n=1 Tax=Vibrio kanaloae TaxID=170673 RepID=A0A4U1ZJG1_9VIBR|nr:hypothetical protein [Vibrio kanaloae]TKF34099.1 hypothetical protein FCV50_05620 [Vibrio kanaloae]
MKYSNNIVLIESPVQIRTFVRFSKMYGVDFSKCMIVIRLNGVEKNDSQIIEIIKKNNINNYHYFTANRNDNLRVLFLTIKTLIMIFVSKSTCSCIFIGDFYSKWMNIIVNLFNFSHTLYLDDGLSTVSAYRDSIEEGRKCLFITEFNLPSAGECKVKMIRTERKKKKIKYKTCLVVGMPMVENEALKNPNVYIDYLIDIKNRFEGFDFEYIPHRYEGKGKIEKIKSIGYEINNLKSSVEEYIDAMPIIPEKIISLYSTALIYLDLGYEGGGIYSYSICLDEINVKFRRSAELSYSYIRDRTEILMIEK